MSYLFRSAALATWVHWFRRDFRVRDNVGLMEASRRAGSNGHVVGIFVFDVRWWEASAEKLGAFQAKFWLESLRELREALGRLNVPLVGKMGRDPVADVMRVAREVKAEGVTWNKEYEPGQMAMDARMAEGTEEAGMKSVACKDAVIFEGEELLTGSETPYLVYSPYMRAFWKKVTEGMVLSAGLPRRMAAIELKSGLGEWPTLEGLGFKDVELDIPTGEKAGARMMEHFLAEGAATYDQTRDWPRLSLKGAKGAGTSRLSAHLNAGTVSIRQAMGGALAAARKQKPRNAEEKTGTMIFTNELIWREFYRMILYHFAQTVSQPFHERYRNLPWTNNEANFAAWRAGRTGYPIVDAAMRQLNQTGFMHNRLRMIAAMFLAKDLDIHWVLGERYFMRTLMDYDQACNVGGWQWSASTGTDAVPYFRVMNPVLQSERWDRDGEFIRHFVPELRGVSGEFIHSPWLMDAGEQKRVGCVIGKQYPGPLVDHAEAKGQAVEKFKSAK